MSSVGLSFLRRNAKFSAPNLKVRGRWRLVPVHSSAQLLNPRAYVLTLVLLACAALAHAQQATMRIDVQSDGKPVQGASVVVNDSTHETGSDGIAAVTLAPGTFTVVVSKKGLMPGTASSAGTMK